MVEEETWPWVSRFHSEVRNSQEGIKWDLLAITLLQRNGFFKPSRTRHLSDVPQQQLESALAFLHPHTSAVHLGYSFFRILMGFSKLGTNKGMVSGIIYSTYSCSYSETPTVRHYFCPHLSTFDSNHPQLALNPWLPSIYQNVSFAFVHLPLFLVHFGCCNKKSISWVLQQQTLISQSSGRQECHWWATGSSCEKNIWLEDLSIKPSKLNSKGKKDWTK